MSNFALHCIGCDHLSYCDIKENVRSGTLPVDGFIWESDCFCERCVPDSVDDEMDPSEEWDSPQHCAVCGVPLKHGLTIEGWNYVREAIKEGDGCCRIVWREIWGSQLGFDIKKKFSIAELKRANTQPGAKKCIGCGGQLKDPGMGPIYKHCPKCEP